MNRLPSGLMLCEHSSESMHEIAAESVPLVIAGPLYFPDSVKGWLYGGDRNGMKPEEVRDMVLDYAQSLQPVFAECARVLRPGGHLVVQTRDVRVGGLVADVESAHRGLAIRCGLEYRCRHFWVNRFHRPERRGQEEKDRAEEGPMPRTPEVFLVFKKPGAAYLGEPLEGDADLLNANFMETGSGSMKARHPYQAPLPVLNAFVRTYSRPGDTVVDPFAGCGTTALAALRSGRGCILYEIDPEAVGMIRTNFAEEAE